MYMNTQPNNIQKRPDGTYITNIDDHSYPLIPLANGQFTIVSWEDFDMLKKYNWYLRSTDNYIGTNITLKGEKYESPNGRIKTKQKTLLLHTLIRPKEKGKVLDHINGCRIDNRRENLRLVSRHVNAVNRTRVNSNNKLQTPGVTQRRKRFVARITINGVLTYLGIYKTKEEAAQVYQKAQKELLDSLI